MDRDNRWDRVEKAYDLLTLAQGEFQADTAVAGLQAAYARDENDEFVKATVIRAEGQPDAAMEDGDALIFMNFRADRAREITRAFVNADFDGFARKKVVNVDFVMLTEYAADIKTAVAYPPASLVNTFGEWMAKNDKTQLRISETEKYAHVTFFFPRLPYNAGYADVRSSAGARHDPTASAPVPRCARSYSCHKRPGSLRSHPAGYDG